MKPVTRDNNDVIAEHPVRTRDRRTVTRDTNDVIAEHPVRYT